MLSVCKSWFPRGSGQQFKVPTRWGSQGRINLIGTLALNAQGEHLEVRELTASCTQDTVIAYVDTLAEQADAEQRRLGKKRLTVIVLDNASFHRGQAIRDRLPVWAAKGLLLRYLPPYCPMLNRIETTWRILKGFLMPRRCYDTVAQLRAALLTAFIPSGPLVLGLDDTIERRTGEKISARGIYHDPVRSSHGHFVKASGLRWLSLMLLIRIPWANRIWALPFLTALVPSQRYHEERGHRHKTLTDWARQMLRIVQRWCPGRQLIVVADSAYAVIRWLSDLQQGHPITVITRLRLDAALYDPAPERGAGQMGRPRLKGDRLPTLASLVHDPATRWERVSLNRWYGETNREVEIVSQTAIWYHNGLPPLPVRWVLVRDPQGKFSTQALLCTDLLQTPVQILEYFMQRWQREVTFEEVRAHLGVETQRQWTDLAIARTTPCAI